MSEIPDDIRAAAKVAEDHYGYGDLSLSDAFAAAILVERKRCAELAKFVADIKPGDSIGRALGEEAQRVMAETGDWLLTEILGGVRPPISPETAAFLELAISGAKPQ